LAAVGGSTGIAEGAAAFTGTGSLSAVGASTAEGAATFTGEGTLAAVGEGAATINDVNFDSSTWHAFTAPTATQAFTGAFKYRRTSTGVSLIMSSEGANNSRIRASSGTFSNLTLSAEETSGSPHNYTASVSQQVGDVVAVAFAVEDGNQKLMIDGTLVASGTDAIANNFKQLSLINSSTSAGSDQNDFDLIGPIFYANEYIDVETYWSSFFDGSNDPVFSSTVEGVAADFFVDEDAAGWNALGGTSGTVTDN
jgi:hypothetical protein